jgi:hypothetical protein
LLCPLLTRQRARFFKLLFQMLGEERFRYSPDANVCRLRGPKVSKLALGQVTAIKEGMGG